MMEQVEHVYLVGDLNNEDDGRVYPVAAFATRAEADAYAAQFTDMRLTIEPVPVGRAAPHPNWAVAIDRSGEVVADFGCHYVQPADGQYRSEVIDMRPDGIDDVTFSATGRTREDAVARAEACRRAWFEREAVVA